MERLTTKGYTYHSLDFMEDGAWRNATALISSVKEAVTNMFQ